MTLAEQMGKMALEYAKNNAIAMPGDIVETLWGDWKKLHRVMVYRVGAHLVTRCRDKCHYWDGKGWVAEFDMKYYALRLYKDGTPRDKVGSGIALRCLQARDGRKWVADGEDFNNVAVVWTYARLEGEE